MTTPPPDKQPAAETLEEIAAQFVADLPPTTDCAFNVAKKGQHRFCSRMGRKPIGGYYFCQRHADVVALAILETVGPSRLRSALETEGVEVE